mgnify:CR=1 FL=1
MWYASLPALGVNMKKWVEQFESFPHDTIWSYLKWACSLHHVGTLTRSPFQPPTRCSSPSEGGTRCRKETSPRVLNDSCHLVTCPIEVTRPLQKDANTESIVQSDTKRGLRMTACLLMTHFQTNRLRSVLYGPTLWIPMFSEASCGWDFASALAQTRSDTYFPRVRTSGWG